MLRVNEIFYSIQGESSEAGRPCIFIRLTGCKLRCTYCDTKYAYYEGSEYSIPQIMQKIAEYPCGLVEVTGGEPLEQKETPELLLTLKNAGYEVLLETDGVEDLSAVPQGIKIIIDVKTPGSRMANPKSAKNIQNLRQGDEIKFVLVDENDYEFAKNFIGEHKLAGKFLILFSPVMPQTNYDWLTNRILADNLPVRLQLQLHKILWGDKRGV